MNFHFIKLAKIATIKCSFNYIYNNIYFIFVKSAIEQRKRAVNYYSFGCLNQNLSWQK